jgi:S-DNA-T family DNA segregation ATPase FtsK/SpoIIIE
MSSSKKNKKVWLAVVLALFFGPWGNFYVSWRNALVNLVVYHTLHAIYPSSTLIVVIFWFLCPLAIAIFFCYIDRENKNDLEKLTSQTNKDPTKPSTSNHAIEPSVNPERSQLSESAPNPHKPSFITPDAQTQNKIKNLIQNIKEKLSADMQDLVNKASSEAFDPDHAAATSLWKDVRAISLIENPPAKCHLPEKIRVGDMNYRNLGNDKISECKYPLSLPISKRALIHFLTEETALDLANNSIQSIILRLVSSLPAGAARIHLIDINTMGRAFSPLAALDPILAPLAPASADQRVKLFREMTDRVTDISRRCLSQHKWLCDYNKANPDQTEMYNFICISALEGQLDKESLEIIKQLLSNECAARCGIYFFANLRGNDLLSLKNTSRTVIWCEDANKELFIFDHEFDNTPSNFLGSKKNNGEFYGLVVKPEALPAHSAELIESLNATLKAKPKQKKIDVTVDESKIWNSNASHGVSIPIGKAGREEIFFCFGNDAVVHHALIGGATGTGKTVLLHNIILNAADLYSPEDLQMILLDFKEGTEFACYEGLPHMRVLSVASELHFGHNVFEWLVAERMRRAGLFKKVGAANLGDYLSKSESKMPRILVIMDEFQRILSDPSIGSQVALLLDDIVRTGRSFGINLILSTQSLANVQLESSTLTSVGLRICMRLSEQEATRFLNYDNTLPTSFNQAGQAVYNDSEGRKEGNKEFQVGFVEVSDINARCAALKQREMERYGKRVVDSARVFHGEIPVDPHRSLPEPSGDQLEAFIGEPLKLDTLPVAVKLEQKDGANLIAIAQSFDILNTLSSNLAVQFLKCPTAASIFIIDSFPLAKERWAQAVDRGAMFLTTPQSINEALDVLIAELETRKPQEAEVAFSPKLLFLIEPQGSKAFPVSTTGEASPAALKVQALLDQGSRHGIHVILMSSRLSRTDKVLGNFGPLNLQPFSIRIAFKSEEASALIYDSSTRTLGSYSGVISDEATGEITPFQIYDIINT